MSDSFKLTSLNNQPKSNKDSTINDDSQVHPNIELNTEPKTDKMIQDTDNSDKSKIPNSKSQEGNCHGSSSDTTANKINPYYLIG